MRNGVLRFGRSLLLFVSLIVFFTQGGLASKAYGHDSYDGPGYGMSEKQWKKEQKHERKLYKKELKHERKARKRELRRENEAWRRANEDRWEMRRGAELERARWEHHDRGHHYGWRREHPDHGHHQGHWKHQQDWDHDGD